MFPDTIANLLDLRTLPTGRALYALRQLALELASVSAPDVAAYVEAGLATGNQAWEMERRWLVQRDGGDEQGDLRPLDVTLDRALAALFQAVKAWAPQRPENAFRVLRQVFPSGVSAVMRMTYPEEIEAVARLLEHLKGELAADVEALHVEPFVDTVREAHAEFRQTLDSRVAPEIAFDQVRAARADANEALLRVVAVIMGKYPGDLPEHGPLRRRLLAPILAQNDAVGASLKAHRPVTEVDPSNGEEIDDIVTDVEVPVVE
jgi:hypothetical protein